MGEEFAPLSRTLGIIGYLLSAGNLAFWFWLILTAKRVREYPHFATESVLFAVGLVFFVAAFVSVAAPMEYRYWTLLWLRVIALLLGIAFTLHTFVAVRMRRE